MYKLIIVDDEYTIRKGLKQYIPWNTLGFEVAGVFEDGLSAMSFLSSNPVDVILTDIDMPIMNGIQLIKSAREKNLAAYCLVISGYQDFNYARQLIPLHTTDYILKPIDNDYVQKTFLKIKNELDETAKKEEKISKEHNQLLLMRNTLLQQFLSDIILERISYTQALKHMEALDLGIDFSNAHIIYSELLISNMKQLLQKTWHYGIDALYDSIVNFCKNSIPHHLYEFIKAQDSLCLVYIDTTDAPVDSLVSSFKSEVNKACSNIREMSSIELSVQSVCNYRVSEENHTSMINNSNCKVKNSSNDSIDLNYFYTSIHSALLDHNFASVNERLDALLLKTSYLPLEKALIIYEKLLDILLAHSSDDKESGIIWKNRLKSSTDITQYHSVLLEYVKEINSMTNSDTSHQIDILMDQALAYIDKNYRKDISRNDVSNYVFLSPSYFSRCFKQRTDMKFIDYLTKIRIQKACELLLSPENRINDVCFAVGYNSPSYFTRVFKYCMGVTPNDYIRKNILLKETK